MYYPAGGAMRVDGALYYILKDHLGSANVVTDSTGADVGGQRYYPFGETRFTTDTMYTDKLFTGQREMTGLGIYHYGARFFSPKLGRFLSVDTIVPGYANPQNLNRYAYTRNNPVRYTDPSGHMPAEGCGDDGKSQCAPTKQEIELNKRRENKFRQRTEYLKCWAGDTKRCSGFDKAIIALDNLDLGDGTIQVGFSINGFARALGIRGDIGVAIDFKGNMAVITTGGGGGYAGVGGGAGGYLTVTNAPSVDYLEGPNVQIGGQIGQGETVGAEYVMFKGSGRDQYRGISISDKAQLQVPWPFEFHGTATSSKILYQRNLPDLFVDIFRP